MSSGGVIARENQPGISADYTPHNAWLHSRYSVNHRHRSRLMGSVHRPHQRLHQMHRAASDELQPGDRLFDLALVDGVVQLDGVVMDEIEPGGKVPEQREPDSGL